MKLLAVACLAVFAVAETASAANPVTVDLKDVRYRIGTDRSNKMGIGVEVEGIGPWVLNGKNYDARFTPAELQESLGKKLDVEVRLYVNQVISAAKYEEEEFKSRSSGQYLINSVSQYWFDKDIFSGYKTNKSVKISDARLLENEPLTADSLACLSKQVKEVNQALADLRNEGKQPSEIAIHIVDANSCEVNSFNKGAKCSELLKEAGLNILQIKSYISKMKTLDLLKADGETEKTLIRAAVNTSGDCDVTSKKELKKILAAQEVTATATEQSGADKEKAYKELFDL